MNAQLAAYERNLSLATGRHGPNGSWRRLFCDKASLVKFTLCTQPIFERWRLLQDLDPPAFCTAEDRYSRKQQERMGAHGVIFPTASWASRPRAERRP